MRWIDLGRLLGLVILFNILGIVLHLTAHMPMDREGNFWLAMAVTILWAIRDQQGDPA